MKYKKIIINGYIEKTEQNTPYISYFKREAQVAHRDNFVEFTDFFNGCIYAINDYKRQIQWEYEHNIFGYSKVLNQYYIAQSEGQTTGSSGTQIQVLISDLKNTITAIRDRGYKENEDYRCNISEDGDIISHSIYSLYYSDIEDLETAVIQARQGFETAVPPDKTDFQIPVEVLTALQQAGYTDKNNKWIGQKNLCAYFVDTFFKSQTNKWEIGKKIFGVMNLAQLKDLYENTKAGKPRNHKIIDDILQKYK